MAVALTTCTRCGKRAPEGSRFCPACGAPLAPAAERRKLVTIVFADVVGSTALGERVDSETLRWAMQRWFRRMTVAIERHGGTVENYIGDAVMAVFGIPVGHEDDALRAVRAAAEMREEVETLRDDLRRERGVELAVRIGVNTGEAVTGAAAGGGFFTAGDIVNVAARLEQSAAAGEILLGRGTFRLVSHAVDAEPVPPLSVKGKREALEAFRLLAVIPAAHGRQQRLLAPMVGRERERGLLLEAFADAVSSRGCRLVTVVGAAGVGKSRLVGDVTDALRQQAEVATGRCLPYGEGLTWWPLVEALGTSGLAATGEGPEFAIAAELLEPAGEPVAPEDAQWAVRTVLETLARRRPLVLVVDDLQWAEPALMELLEHVVRRARDAPLLLLVTARPELAPDWGAAGTRITLEPLVPAVAADLLRHLLGTARLGDRAAARILDVAEGNPLFLEEIVAMLDEEGVLPEGGGLGPAELDAIAVPPTIHALLAARLDRLAPSERAVVEAASIEGKEFARESTAALIGCSIDAELRALVAKDLIRPVTPETFHFRHELVRDAAYDGMPKQLRADLHERFADRPGAMDELVGHHLERAILLRRELGEAEGATMRLAGRAARCLRNAAARAAQRDDPAVASALLERAIALVRADPAAAGALLPALGAALFEAGRMADATRVLDEAIAHAADPPLAARARIEREFVRLAADTSAGTEPARLVADEMLPVLERAGDDHGRCRLWSLRAQAAWITGRVGAADAAWREAAACARRAGDERELFRILGWRATAAVLGPTPVPEAIDRCRAFRDVVAASPVAVASMVNPLASLHAMRGEFEVADGFLEEANETLRRLGSLGASVSHHEALVRLLEGRPALAEPPLRASLETLASMREAGMLATTAAMLAQAVHAEGRPGEADELCAVAADSAADDDIVTQVIWRGVKSRLLAREERCEEAEALARAAVALVEPTDLLSHRADAMLDLADVLHTCSRTNDSRRAAGAALSLYEQKGNVVGAMRARSMLGDGSGGT